MMLEPQNGRQKVTRIGPFQCRKLTAQHTPNGKQHVVVQEGHIVQMSTDGHIVVTGLGHKQENL